MKKNDRRNLKLVKKDEKPTVNKPFELIVDNANPASPTLRVAWQLSPEGLAALRDANVLYPHMLVVTYQLSDNGCIIDEQRQLAPLDQGMMFLSFSHPGRHLIFGCVVWSFQYGPSTSKRQHWAELYDSYLRLREGEEKACYARNLSDGRNFRFDLMVEQQKLNHYESIGVNVSPDLFAPEPNEFQRWWVNFLFEDGPRDECDFRRRRIVAYSIQIPIVAVLTIFKMLYRFLICMGLAFATYRYINWRAIIHPYSMVNAQVSLVDSMAEKPPMSHRLFALTRADGSPRPRWQWPLFSPSFYPAAAILTYMFIRLPMYTAASIAMIIIIYAITWIGDAGKAWWHGSIQEHIEQSRAVRREALLAQQYQRRLEPLTRTSSVGHRRATLDALPKTHRTIHLRLLDFKAQICRPFRR